MTKETKTSTKSHKKKAVSEQAHTLPGAFDLFNPSVNIIRNNLTGFLLLVGIPLLLLSFNQSFEWHIGAHGYGHKGATSIVGIIGFVLTVLAAPGAIMLQLAGARNETLDYKEAFRDGLDYIWRFIGLALLSGLMLIVAFVLLVVPFFILLPRLVLATYYLIDRDLGPVEAIKASMADYKKYKGTWGILGVNVLLALTGAVPIVGWILSTALGFLYRPAGAIRYEQIKELAKGKPPRTPIEAATIAQ